MAFSLKQATPEALPEEAAPTTTTTPPAPKKKRPVLRGGLDF
jgi:hypothetical protein